MLVSQDMIRLVGFASVLEREWFRLLQTVQGVGTRGGAGHSVHFIRFRNCQCHRACRTSR